MITAQSSVICCLQEILGKKSPQSTPNNNKVLEANMKLSRMKMQNDGWREILTLQYGRDISNTYSIIELKKKNITEYGKHEMCIMQNCVKFHLAKHKTRSFHVINNIWFLQYTACTSLATLQWIQTNGINDNELLVQVEK